MNSLAANTSRHPAKTSVSAEDQQEINEFARVYKRLTEAKSEVQMLSNELQNYEEAANEMELLDENDGLIPFQIGESFICFTPEDSIQRLDYSKQKIQKAVEELKIRIKDIQNKHDTLKKTLYSKFGDNIGLETDD